MGHSVFETLLGVISCDRNYTNSSFLSGAFPNKLSYMCSYMCFSEDD